MNPRPRHSPAAGAPGTNSAWTLAIDFGTSNTVAVMVSSNGVEPVLFEGRPWFPSVVCAEPDGTLVSGLAAFNNRLIRPDSYFDGVKHSLTSDRPHVLLAGRRYEVAEPIAAILAHAMSSAMSLRGNIRPERTVLTHPVVWRDDQIAILREAADLADLPDLTTVDEPVAAAFALYPNERFEPGQHVAVYDLGAGTLDIALLKRAPAQALTPDPDGALPAPFEVIDCTGTVGVGGQKFDTLIEEMLDRGDLGKMPAWQDLQPGSRPSGDDYDADREWIKNRRLLQEEIVRVKEELSVVDRVTLTLPGYQFPTDVTRAQIEGTLHEQLARTVDLLVRFINDCHLRTTDIADVALVGGSSQIPLIRQLLSQAGLFGDRVTSPDSPQTIVARGAAHLALVDRVPPRRDAAQRDVELAEAARADGRWKEAKKAYERASGARDRNWSPQAAYELGRLCTQHPDGVFHSNYNAARRAYRDAMSYDGTEWPAYAALALATMEAELRQFDAAIAAYDNAVRTGHQTVAPEAAFHLGLLQLSRLNPAAAEKAWQTATTFPGSEWSAQAAFELGAYRSHQKNYRGAEQAWKTAIGHRHPAWYPRAAYELGMLREKLKNWRGAGEAYQIAIDSGQGEWAAPAATRLSKIQRRIA